MDNAGVMRRVVGRNAVFSRYNAWGDSSPPPSVRRHITRLKVTSRVRWFVSNCLSHDSQVSPPCRIMTIVSNLERALQPPVEEARRIVQHSQHSRFFEPVPVSPLS